MMDIKSIIYNYFYKNIDYYYQNILNYKDIISYNFDIENVNLKNYYICMKLTHIYINNGLYKEDNKFIDYMKYIFSGLDTKLMFSVIDELFKY